MAIAELTIIGESINDSVPSTKKLFEDNDIEGLKALAVKQDRKGAAYIDINVGRRDAEFMDQLVREVQSVTAKPLSIDTPDPELARAGLAAYDLDCSGGKKPILNSISPLRKEMIDLYDVCPFLPILIVTERINETGKAVHCHTAEETYQAAKDMLEMVRQSKYDIPNEDCIFDPGIAPFGSDTEGLTRRLLESIRLIHEDPDFAGVHMSLGLSNFTVMLPPKRANGEPVKSSLESAFLTKAMPIGLDMVIGSVARKYELLSPDHDAMVCLEECLKLDGFDAVMRIQEFYA